MDLTVLHTFFLWCTIINVALLALMTVLLTLGRDFVYRVHARLFPMPKQSFNVLIYAFIGFFKVMVIIFSIVPLIALSIIR